MIQNNQTPQTNKRPVPGEPLVFEAGKPEPNYRLRRRAAVITGSIATIATLSTGINAIAPIPEGKPELPADIGDKTGIDTPAGFEEDPSKFEMIGAEIVRKPDPNE